MDESSNNDGDDADGRRMLPIITGNWGCGSSAAGDAQLKSMIQWMAASRSGAPSLIYFTAGSSTVVKVQHAFVNKWTFKIDKTKGLFD